MRIMGGAVLCCICWADATLERDVSRRSRSMARHLKNAGSRVSAMSRSMPPSNEFVFSCHCCCGAVRLGTFQCDSEEEHWPQVCAESTSKEVECLGYDYCLARLLSWVVDFRRALFSASSLVRCDHSSLIVSS